MLKKIKFLFLIYLLIINYNHLYSQTHLELRKATQLKSFKFIQEIILGLKKGDDFFTFAKITGMREQI